jgi:hypothetical protein
MIGGRRREEFVEGVVVAEHEALGWDLGAEKGERKRRKKRLGG